MTFNHLVYSSYTESMFCGFPVIRLYFFSHRLYVWSLFLYIQLWLKTNALFHGYSLLLHIGNKGIVQFHKMWEVSFTFITIGCS